MRIHDGAYGTLLAQHLRGGETVDDLCLRDPAAVVEAHRSYLYAGATAIQTNAFLAHLRSSERRRSQLQLAAIACARDAVGDDDALVIATIGPSGDEPRSFWRDLELVLEHGVRAVLCETITSRAIADAVLAAWSDVAAGVQDVELLVGCSIAPSVGSSGASWLLELATEAPAAVRLGLNCCEGPSGLRPTLERLAELRGDAWVMPSAGLPTTGIDGVTRWPLADPKAWVEQILEMIDGLPISSVGGCCGTNAASIAALRENLHEPD